MATSTTIGWLVLVALIMWGVKSAGQLPKAFRHRSCQGSAWLAAFPEASKADIRQFLALFVEAFAFKDEQKLMFAPSDEVLAVYRALYPSRWMPDALELETLADDLSRQYGVSLQAVWHQQLTLGQLFLEVQAHGHAVNAP
ncbi:hypothetical protein [Aquabacterium sp.]|uniref:hypothetical protein n=1 Tax=Aquabacterium sp. TaxID=1872578 RepID=UPI0035B4304C